MHDSRVVSDVSSNHRRGASQDSLAKQLKLALDELRMQMLGTQVLLGFQFQASFQDAFESPSLTQAVLSAAAFALLVAALGFLVAPPSLLRLAEDGRATRRMQRFAGTCTRWALTAFALALACDIFLITDHQFDNTIAAIGVSGILGMSWLAWHGLGIQLKRRRQGTGATSMEEPAETSLHTRIDYMLTESRVILPGAQALLAFQFIVTLMQSFESLPGHVQIAHYIGLGFVVLSVIWLIAPAAIHRIAFDGEDDATFLRIASRIVTAALLPLSIGIAFESYVAIYKLFRLETPALLAAGGVAALLLTLWYIVPLRLRRTG